MINLSRPTGANPIIWQIIRHEIKKIGRRGGACLRKSVTDGCSIFLYYISIQRPRCPLVTLLHKGKDLTHVKWPLLTSKHLADNFD